MALVMAWDRLIPFSSQYRSSSATSSAGAEIEKTSDLPSGWTAFRPAPALFPPCFFGVSMVFPEILKK
jgi:hypothetical protein